ncbi:response regulator transcription factor [Glaciimonas soli]|uniref:Response regulator n=1 Tax=Glaciimonas soli TaxID=2590999 RepID=A0A843YWB6_9BURK|nr:response regulator transcription factor [Glaciimonas soli]MQR01581.1 response regulator [Glaciimonas soli]
MHKIKVLIVDDHPVILHALRIMLEKENYEIVGETENGIDALRLAAELKPDLVILDIGIPRINGLDVIKRLSLNMPRIKVLVLSTQNPRHFAARCLQAGASGYVCKENNIADVIGAAKALMDGYVHFPQITLSRLTSIAGSFEEADLIPRLKVRELVILQHLTAGKSNKEIGELLSISNKTVSTYKVSLMQKLNLQTLADLIDFARRNSLA